MKHKRKTLILAPLAVLLTLMSLYSPNVSAASPSASESSSTSTTISTTPAPPLTAQSAILVDLDSGQVLYQKDPNAKQYPASITKILTAILALEHSKLTDLVTTSKLATEQDGNRIYLVDGEQETMENMLYGLLLNSGNDAAVAIAEHVAGSVPAFADMMNAKAKEIGATNSHFVTPNGLHDPNHYTTAHDMALIARYAMQIPEFRKIVGTEYKQWHGKEWDSTLVNLNRLLWTYEGTTGIKTGYTDQAQQTTVISAKRGNLQLLAVLLDIQGLDVARQEAANLLDYGFQNYHKVKLANKGQVVTTVPLLNQQIHASLAQDVWYDKPTGSTIHPEAHVKLKIPTAPFAPGTPIGSMSYTNGDDLVQIPLLAKEAVTIPNASHVGQILSYTFFGAISLCFLGLLMIRNRKRQKMTHAKQKLPSFYPYE